MSILIFRKKRRGTPAAPVATHLGFTTQPGLSGASPYTLSPQPVVAAQKNDNSTDTTKTGTVTIALNVLTGSPVLSGTTTKALSSGVADFSANALVVTGAGTWTLTASVAGLADGTSSTGTTTGGGPTTLVSDSFTRTAASLGTADTGQTWAGAGSWLTNGTQAKGTTPSTNQVIDSATANRTISVALADLTGQHGITFMYADASNHYRYFFDGSSPTLFLVSVIAGSSAFPIALVQSLSVGDVLKVIISGGTFTLQVNGVTITGGGSLTPDPALASNTKDGIYVHASPSGLFDNYLVTTP